jgi:hypothetical protein
LKWFAGIRFWVNTAIAFTINGSFSNKDSSFDFLRENCGIVEPRPDQFGSADSKIEPFDELSGQNHTSAESFP